MERTSNWHQKPLNPAVIEKLKQELKELDKDMIDLDGRQLKPSQCFHVSLDPVHIMFNTNCPDTLKEKVEALLTKHLGTGEAS